MACILWHSQHPSTFCNTLRKLGIVTGIVQRPFSHIVRTRPVETWYVSTQCQSLNPSLNIVRWRWHSLLTCRCLATVLEIRGNLLEFRKLRKLLAGAWWQIQQSHKCALLVFVKASLKNTSTKHGSTTGLQS